MEKNEFERSRVVTYFASWNLLIMLSIVGKEVAILYEYALMSLYFGVIWVMVMF